MPSRIVLALLAALACLSWTAQAGPPLAPPASHGPIPSAEIYARPNCTEPARPASCEPCVLPCPPPCPPRKRCRQRCNVAELDADLLLWWIRPTPAPILATTSAPADRGILGLATTVPVLGGEGVHDNPLAGGRFAGRYLLDGTVGLALGGFFLENANRTYSAAGLPVLGIPFVDPGTNSPAAFLLAQPGVASGSAEVWLSSRLWGLDTSGVVRLGGGNDDDYQLDLLLGYRFVQLAESLGMRTTTTVAGPGLLTGEMVPPGSTVAGEDFFGTRNSFHGAQLGARGTCWLGAVFVQASAAVALGSIHQVLNISGSSTLHVPGAPTRPAPGSYLTRPTSVGRYHNDRFGVVPQAGVLVGCQLTRLVQLGVGYDFLYINNVLRPGNQIDPVIDPTLTPRQNEGGRTGALHPVARRASTDFWAQGVSFSLQLSY